MHRTKMALSLVLAGAATLWLAGCDASADTREPRYRLILFVDYSASTNQGEQHRRWAGEAMKLTGQLNHGWALSIYGLHDQTMAAAPLFETEVPLATTGGQDDLTELKLARDSARKAVSSAFERPGEASSTDIFSALDRIKPDAQQRDTVVLFFSDMLNSTGELNMERPDALARSNSTLIQRLASNHGWHQGQLSGMQVYCALNSVASGSRGPAINRRVQETFYSQLFSALGARLVRYDTTLGGVGFGTQGGKDHVVR